MTEQPTQDDRKTVYIDPPGLAKAWNAYRANIIAMPSSYKACEVGFSAGYSAAWNTRTDPSAEVPDAVERVARAICSGHGNDPDEFLKALGFRRWVMYQPHARAAIAAMPGGGPGAWVPADHLAEANREIARLREALQLADAALSGANMNMNVVERKVKAALKEHADDPA